MIRIRRIVLTVLLAALIASAAPFPAQAEEEAPTEPTETVTSNPSPVATPAEITPLPDETPPTEENPPPPPPGPDPEPDPGSEPDPVPPVDRCTNIAGTQETIPRGYEDPDGDKVCTKVPSPTEPKPVVTTKTWSGVLMLGHRCSGKGSKVLGGKFVNENTPEACRRAIHRGADGGEWDLQLCNRSFHDSRLARMTTSRGSVSKCHRTYKARLNRTRQKIPSGASMLSHDYGRFSEMHVKERTPLSRVAAHVRYAGGVMDRRKLIVTSSELSILSTANRTSKSVHTNLLDYGPRVNCMSLARKAARSYVHGILVHYRTATAQCVQYMHKLGKTLRVYDVTTWSQFSTLKRRGVDGMNTDSMALVGKE